MSDLVEIWEMLRRRAEEIGILQSDIAQVQYVVNVDPDTGEQNIVAVIRDSLPKIGGRAVPSDAPSIGGQSKDMSPMLSKSHKNR